jgi:hypothetical protein
MNRCRQNYKFTKISYEDPTQQLRVRGEMKKFPFKTSQQIFYISASCFTPQIRDRIIKSGIKMRVCLLLDAPQPCRGHKSRAGSVRAQVHCTHLHKYIWGEQVRRAPPTGSCSREMSNCIVGPRSKGASSLFRIEMIARKCTHPCKFRD